MLFNFSKFKSFIEKFNDILIFWFPGLFIFLYFFLNNLNFLDTEAKEWIIYFLFILILVLIFFINDYINLLSNLILKIICLLFFLIYFFFSIEYSYAQFFFILASIFLSFLIFFHSDSENKITCISYSLIFFIVFNISSKILYWINLKDFFIYKLSTKSKYIQYSDIINFISTPLIILVFFISIFILYLSNKIHFNFFFLRKFWFILPTIILFLESFSTFKFFENVEGTMIHHWQLFIGPIEMMKQGGYLLWDIPSQYGFLSIISAYIIPFDDPWIKVYYLNSLLKLISGLIIFYTIWNNKGFIWYLISLLITISILFVFTITPSFENSSITPSSGPLRFIWVIISMFLIIKNKDKNIKSQILLILPIWLISFFWSIESAVIVSILISPLLFYFLIYSQKNILKSFFYILIYPISIISILIIISIYYYLTIKSIPDYYLFFEHAISYSSGFNSQPINIFGPIIIFLFLISLIFTNIFYLNTKLEKYLVFSLVCGLWASTSYCIGRSDDTDLMRIFFLFIFGFFLITNNFNVNKKLNLILVPLFTCVISFSFGNPSIVKHILGTLNNQNYFLKDINVKEHHDLLFIFDQINDYTIPIAYIQPGRFRDNLYKKEFFDKNNNLIKINNNIWIPYNPAELFTSLKASRSKKIIKRWINRHPYDKGWFINTRNSDVDHWHKIYEDSLYRALEDYEIIKKIEYGDLKAILFKRN